MKNAKHIVKTVLFCGTLAVFSAVSVFIPKEKGSFYENRRLAVFPVPSVETGLDGTFRRTSRPAPTRMIPCARTSSLDWMRAALTA